MQARKLTRLETFNLCLIIRIFQIRKQERERKKPKYLTYLRRKKYNVMLLDLGSFSNIPFHSILFLCCKSEKILIFNRKFEIEVSGQKLVLQDVPG